MPGRVPDPNTINPRDKRPKSIGDGKSFRPPAWLNDKAKKIFKDTVKEIVALGITSRADINVLAIFSLQMDRLITLSTHNDGELSSQRMLNDLSTQCLALIRELGIGPSSRAKLRIASIEEHQTSIEDFLEDE